MNNLDLTTDQKIKIAQIKQELLTPAEMIYSYSELLFKNFEEKKLTHEIEDCQKILSASNKLMNLVTDLLNPDNKNFNSKENLKDLEIKIRHDLRTPINAIKGYSEILLEDLVDLKNKQINDDLNFLVTESNNFLAKIGNIINFSTSNLDNSKDTIFNQKVLDDLEKLISSDNQNETYKEIDIGHILIVDDIQINRELVSRHLKDDGHIITEAIDGEEAIELMRSHNFDLILLDVIMPRKSGIEVLIEMKNDEDLKNMPVIMMSALDDTTSITKCIEAGADDYLPKPVNLKLLRARIKSGIYKKQSFDKEKKQNKFIKEAFSKFVPEVVVNELIKNPNQLILGGKRQEITIIFTDLEKFTELIEQTEPSIVLPILNNYLDGLCKLVLKHGGTIDKIIGDALLAFFGAPIENPKHCLSAMNCALEIDFFCRKFREKQIHNKLKFGNTRIAVHTGKAIVGNFGGESFFDYTVQGDLVNTASRMEQINKKLGTRMCVSEDISKKLKNHKFRPIGQLIFKGKTKPISAFEPILQGLKQAPIKEYEKAYKWLNKDKEKSFIEFKSLKDLYPNDPLCLFHYNRLKQGSYGSIITFEEK